LDACLTAEESLTTWSWVGTSFVWQADRAVDKRKVRDGGVLFEDLGVDKRGEDTSMPSGVAVRNTISTPSAWRTHRTIGGQRRHCCWRGVQPGCK